jgi:small subunit ribosomal protein S16
MLVIRLRRIGKKNKPTYRVVLAEHSWAASGKFTADLGFYNPHTKEVKIDKDTVMEWLKKGAKPSNTVARLLENLKIKHASIVVVKRNKKSKKAEVAVKAEVTPKNDAPTEVDENISGGDVRTEAVGSAKIDSGAAETASAEVSAEPEAAAEAEAEIKEETEAVAEESAPAEEEPKA